MEYNIAMTESTNRLLNDFLLKDTSDEEICFAIWHPAEGKSRYSVLIRDIIFPEDKERIRDGTVSALPEYVDRVKELAREKGGGLAMIHTHPGGVNWQNVSSPDLYYEQDVLSREVFGITGYPFVGMTLAGNGTWSGRIYPIPFKIKWCSAIRIVGKNLTIHFNPKIKFPPRTSKKQIRTLTVWGKEKQADIARMKVGIIGVGSVGSMVGETLARLGVGEIFIMDYDKVKIHNLDRMNCLSEDDVGRKKIDVVQKNLTKAATANKFLCTKSESSVVEPDGYKEALDCDVIFSCVDRPWPRQVLNNLAYSCLIPVVDGGISFKVLNETLIHGMYRAQTVGPERACMSCLKAFDAGEVQRDRDGLFDDPKYIEKLESESGPTRQSIMPFVVALAGLEAIQFVELVTNMGKMGDLGQQPYNYYPGDIIPILKDCVLGCEYVGKIAFGDSQKPYLATDKSRARELKPKKRKWRERR
ncbi:MAG: HesA/MoeB/ThiF family protein [Nitrosotalea sp.]